MKSLRIVLIMLLLSVVVFIGTPGVTRAVDNKVTMPTTKFTQDKNNPGLVDHDFKGDDGMLTPDGANVDDGFYVNVAK